MIFAFNYKKSYINRKRNMLNYLKNKPDAVADIKGSFNYPNIEGKVKFFQAPEGVIVMAEIEGLPTTNSNIFAFHIHEGESCTGTRTNPFSGAGGHYNPTNSAHPEHAGDLPPLFSNNGFAFQVVLTDKFKVEDILKRTIIIHLNPDDFSTQPSGNSGLPIACGIIRKI
jgi:Cu-Zn family superoxide dismutase